MLDPKRYGERSTAFDKDHQRDPRPFLGSARHEIHRLLRPFDMEKEYLFDPKLNGDLKTADRRQAR